MIDSKSILAIIPARGKSKELKKKNTKKLCGKPLVVWSITEAKKSKYIDCVALSSEDEQILSIGKQCGVDVLIKRPKELSKDDVTTAEVVLRCYTIFS